ncbi:uncharacterized protein LOC128385935 [Panonychus citri]|uniref:uncharacterized protein LOC128385935 n=1 Tax=Panonychus citri TaxID=50023 RepID=UPI002307CB82|nr:uncharacterized protein LOC128385935 [Panonychus citri]
MPRPISPEIRSQIFALHNQGYSYNEISTELGVSASTAWRWVNLCQQRGDLNTRYLGSTSNLSEADKENLLLKWIEDPFKPSTVIRKELELDCTSQTINNFFRSQGIKTRHAAIKPRLNEQQRMNRVVFATLYKDLDVNKCIFMDESCFSSSREGIKNVKRTIGTRYDQRFTSKSDHCTRKVVSTWAAITVNGVGPLVTLDCRLDQYVYLEILDTLIVDLVKSQFGQSECFLIDDNCPAHRANLINEWLSCCNYLHNINLKLIKLPPYSPELNLIENVWGCNKKDFLYSDCVPNTRDEMKDFIVSNWNSKKLIPNYCENLFNSWTKRCEDIIYNDGYAIKY